MKVGAATSALPDGWEVRELGELSSKTTVGFVGSMSHLFTRNGVPLLRGTNVHPGWLQLDDMRFISEGTHSRWTKSALEPGDLVMVRVGYPGTACVIPPDLGPANAASLVISRPRSSVLNPYFAMYVLNSPQGIRQLQGQLVGGAQQVFNTTLAAKFQMPVPQRPEQDRIVAALKDVDALIQSTIRQITKKQAIRQGMMQQLLSGRTRLPGFDRRWTTRRLSDLGLTVRGVGYKPDQDLSSRRTATTVDLLRANNVQDASLDLRDVQYVHRRRVRADQYLRSGDVLICAANGSRQLVGKAAPIRAVGAVPRTFGAFMMVYRPNAEAILPSFAALHFQTKRYRDWIEVLLAGSSINNLRPADLAALEIQLPERKEQVAIADALKDAEDDIHVWRHRLAKARSLKTGMMQQLLTGRTRLPVEAS